jgi:hypothetical protein
MALVDNMRVGKEWEGLSHGAHGTLAFDAQFERYARFDSKEKLISIRRVADDMERRAKKPETRVMQARLIQGSS